MTPLGQYFLDCLGWIENFTQVHPDMEARRLLYYGHCFPSCFLGFGVGFQGVIQTL